MDNNEILRINNITDILTALPSIDSESTYWMVRTEGGKYYSDFVMGQYVGVGHDELLLQEAQESSPEHLAKLLKERTKTTKDGRPIASSTYGLWAGQIHRFANEIKAGDYILIPGASSERFSLGIVDGDPYELTNKQLKEINDEKIEGRERSPYKKRIRVQFLSSFSRVEADPALYKMIYTQGTLTQINKFAPYILRACFDAYVSGNQVYLTFPVTQKEDIKARPYTTFTYNLTESYAELNSEADPIIKNNVQSAGVVQLILDNAPIIGLFCLGWVAIRSQNGFTADFNFFKGKFKLKKEDERLVIERVKDAQIDRDIREKDATQARNIRKQQAEDEHLESLIRMAERINDSKISMDKIQAETPSELKEAVKKAATPDDEIQE